MSKNKRKSPAKNMKQKVEKIIPKQEVKSFEPEDAKLEGSVIVKVPMVDNRYTIQKIAESNNYMAIAVSDLAKTNEKLASLLMLAPQITVQDSTFISNGVGLKIETEPEKYSIKEYALNTEELEEK